MFATLRWQTKEQYAKNMSLPCPRHTLLPRARLLHLVLPDLKKAGVAELVDLTIAYPPGCSALTSKWSLTEFGTLKRHPYNVHVNIRIIPINSLGSSLEEVQQSLYKLYDQKDALLDRCAAEGCFPDAQQLVVPICWWAFQVLAWMALIWCLFAFFAHFVAAMVTAGNLFLIASISSATVLSAAWWNKDMLPAIPSGKSYVVITALAAVALSAAACSLPSHLEWEPCWCWDSALWSLLKSFEVCRGGFKCSRRHGRLIEVLDVVGGSVKNLTNVVVEFLDYFEWDVRNIMCTKVGLPWNVFTSAGLCLVHVPQWLLWSTNGFFLEDSPLLECILVVVPSCIPDPCSMQPCRKCIVVHSNNVWRPWYSLIICVHALHWNGHAWCMCFINHMFFKVYTMFVTASQMSSCRWTKRHWE